MKNRVLQCNTAIANDYNIATAIIFSQLEYWFGIMGNPFYKFLQPCKNHELYKEGDSWIEELGIGRSAFLSNFDKIGTRLTHTEYDAIIKSGGDPFQGKFFLTVSNMKMGTTRHFRNTPLVDAYLEQHGIENKNKGLACEHKPIGSGGGNGGGKKTKIMNVRKEREPKAEKSLEPEYGCYQSCVAIWDNFLQVKFKTNLKAEWGKNSGVSASREGQALKGIIDKIRTNIELRGGVADDTRIANGFNEFLKTFDEWNAFHQKPLLTHLNQYFTTIRSELINKRKKADTKTVNTYGKQATNKNGATEASVARAFAERLKKQYGYGEGNNEQDLAGKSSAAITTLIHTNVQTGGFGLRS